MPTFLLVKVRKEKNSVKNVQGDEGKLNYRGNRYTVKEFDRVVGFQEKGKLSALIEQYKHSTES